MGTRVEIENEAMLRFVRERTTEVDYAMTVCTGTAILAKAGVLDGRKATTNKMMFEWVSAQGPQVEWIKAARWGEDGKFVTSSGVSAGMDMALAVIAKLTSKQVSETLAVATEYEWHQDASWDPFAKAAGLVCSFVSNGNATEEVLEYLRPLVSLYKVDLKGFRDRGYRELGGTLERVLWTIGALKARGFWVEVVTLVVPGHNDSPEELRDIARFLVSVSPDIPWHVTAFHPDYRMEDRRATEARSLLLAAETGLAEGLRFVYAGNLPGAVRRFENTYCPSCRALLVERTGYRVTRNAIGADGLCPSCRAAIPGVWA
jgi:pyruvate formate lyase activating enzyme